MYIIRNPIFYIMNDYIEIAQLNDFVFCPYSIYLHNIFSNSDESIYKATPQLKGTHSHRNIDNKLTHHNNDLIYSLSVCSNKYQLYGKIDTYRISTCTLVKRKYRLSQIYQGQIYQLWAQYLCMIEMGYEVQRIGFYEISTNKCKFIPLPSEADLKHFSEFLIRFKSYNPIDTPIIVNPNKCTHCIYCNLCDKTIAENVY